MTSLDNVTAMRFMPAWMWSIVAIEIIVPSYFAIASYVDPTIWGEAALGIYGELYVIRNLAMSMGVALAAFWLRSYAALFATIAARFATDVVDILAGFARGPDSETVTLLVIFTVILIVIPAFGLRWLLVRLKS
ncbi:MAG: hypothetical protein AAF292_17725 [Pseudomonadota bacterium]